MRVLAIDPGARRLGLALSDATGTLATPWRVIESGGSIKADIEKLAAIVTGLRGEDDSLAMIVVGLPLRLDGTPTDQTTRARELAARLESVTGLPIVLQDERLTSTEAEQRLALRMPDWRKRKEKLDAAAAAIILQDYLDRRER
ncbi:MAG TPA: Holliday junction resolvase RuvX [Vicinamibacterales bacterium]